jgi:hypothetical protein
MWSLAAALQDCEMEEIGTLHFAHHTKNIFTIYQSVIFCFCLIGKLTLGGVPVIGLPVIHLNSPCSPRFCRSLKSFQFIVICYGLLTAGVECDSPRRFSI